MSKKEENNKSKTETPEKNIIFVGKRQRLNKETGKTELVPREAPPFIQDGNDKIKLPAPEDQAKGFYHQEASRIIALYPNDYKPFVEKGS